MHTNTPLTIKGVPGTHLWVVMGALYGINGVVFRGSLFRCLAYVRENG